MKSFKLIICTLFFSPCLVFGQWVSVLEIPGGSPPQAFTDNGNGRLFFASIGLAGGVYSTINNGVNWVFSNNGINSNLYSISVKDSIVFVGAQNGIYRSTNNGVSFIHLLNDIGAWTSRSVLIIDNTVYVGFLNGLYKSTNLGNNWVTVNNGFPQYPFVISLSSSNNNIYAGIEASQGSGVFKSTNLGEDWVRINNEIPNTIPYSIYSNLNLVMVGTALGMYISTNYGSNWRLIPEIPGNIGLFGLASIGTQIIFISAWENGVYVSTNGGLNWMIKNEGLYPDLRLTCLYTLNGYVYVGTNSYQYYPNIFRRPVSELVPVIENNSELPKDFRLYQNYPNPFNSKSKIKYQIVKTQNKNKKVQLKIYNSLGKWIATLVDKVIGPGNYEVTFNGDNLPSGIYFYQLKTSEFVDSKKMVYIK